MLLEPLDPNEQFRNRRRQSRRRRTIRRVLLLGVVAGAAGCLGTRDDLPHRREEQGAVRRRLSVRAGDDVDRSGQAGARSAARARSAAST